MWCIHRCLDNFISGAKKPFVAAVDGLALGGGLEVAMASSELYFISIGKSYKIDEMTFSRFATGLSCTYIYTYCSVRITRAATWNNSWFWR